jgi:hypothetical protein
MYQKYRRPFHEAGFEIVDCPPMTATGKTSTDIHLVLDVMDALADSTHFDEFIVFSADADFSPVLRRLRRHDRRTVVFAAGAMSESYKASADRVIDIQTFLQDALQLTSMEDSDPPFGEGGLLHARPHGDLRIKVADWIRDMVTQADQPVALPTLAQLLRREFEELIDSRWDGAGSFGTLMRELQIEGVEFDFSNDSANDVRRMARRSRAQIETTSSQASMPERTSMGKHTTDSTDTGLLIAELPLEELQKRAERVIRDAVAHSTDPLHFSVLGNILRQEIPQLRSGWPDAPNLAAFLHNLDIEPIRRAVLENGTTNVLYDPARHEEPAGVVGDRLVASMLRAAELPAVRGVDLARILSSARPHMGDTDRFEIAEVSRNVATSLAAEGHPISARRIATVLQALIFGGLDATKNYDNVEDLTVDAMGVIIAAWAREMQTMPDEDTRNRLLAWFEVR